jgi:hypothetical protein
VLRRSRAAPRRKRAEDALQSRHPRADEGGVDAERSLPTRREVLTLLACLGLVALTCVGLVLATAHAAAALG